MKRQRPPLTWGERTGLVIIALITLSLAGLWLDEYVPTTVAEGHRGTNGYTIQKHRFTKGLLVKFWIGASLKSQRDLPDSTLLEVRTQKWLGRNRAVLIEIDHELHLDSSESSHELSLLYDFDHQDIHSYEGEIPKLAEFPSDRNQRDEKRREFDEIVVRLDQ